MFEIVVAVLLVLITVLYFAFSSKASKAKEPEVTNNTSQNKAETIKNVVEEKNEKIVDNKSILINSFREGKDLRHPFCTKDGKYIFFHDDKRIYLGLINNLVEKNPKFLTKTIEQDLIADASFSEDKK